VNLADLLRASAERHPDRSAATDVHTGRSLTYAQLAREAETVATFLRAHGVGNGMRVALVASNGLAYLPAAFGLLAAGACLTPIASSLSEDERGQILRDIDVNACFSASVDTAPPAEEGTVGSVLTQGECAGFDFRWARRGANAPADFLALNPAAIRFTSGTTAASKGVILSHEATLARVVAASEVLRLDAEDRVLWVLPLAYHFAATITAYVRAAAHILLCPDTLPGTVAAALRQRCATVFYASPLHFERLSNLRSEGRLDALRLALSTTAPIPEAIVERFERTYGVAVGQAYGIIEAGLPCINTRADGTPPASVGAPVPGYDVAVLSEGGERRAAGEEGEVGVRGAGLFSGYYSPWVPLEQATRGGWFLSGDVGRFDARGALYLVGRKKSVLSVAGMKFFPEEVEVCLNRFPGVRESRVSGRPHAHLGEVPCAEIALEVPERPFDLEALKAHCARQLSTYRVPVEFRVVDAVPRSPGGKILRR
jgi:long-chain acyl-CoA synthetase